jgi:putative hydrolase of the HAD superfamily
MEIKGIIFDNDNTLYQVPNDFQDSVLSKMDNLISHILDISSKKSIEIRKNIYKKYKSTSLGFCKMYNYSLIDFYNKTYLSADFNLIKKNENLIMLLEELPQKKIVLTNNPRCFAEKILEKIGIIDYFDKIIGEEDMNYKLKPNITSYLIALKYLNIENNNILMVDDNLDNLITAHNLGIKTAIINNQLVFHEYVDFTLSKLHDLKNIFRE